MLEVIMGHSNTGIWLRTRNIGCGTLTYDPTRKTRDFLSPIARLHPCAFDGVDASTGMVAFTPSIACRLDCRLPR